MGSAVFISSRVAASPARVPPVRRPAPVLHRFRDSGPAPGEDRVDPHRDRGGGVNRFPSPVTLYARVGRLRRSPPRHLGRYVDFSV